MPERCNVYDLGEARQRLKEGFTPRAKTALVFAKYWINTDQPEKAKPFIKEAVFWLTRYEVYQELESHDK